MYTITRLEKEWERLATSTAAAEALTGWRRIEPALAGFADLEALRRCAHRRDNPEGSDRLLAALTRLAAVTGHGDRLAARVLLQLLLPGAARIAASLTRIHGDRYTCEAALLAELTIGIRTYPWRRRPHHVAANLLMDARQRLIRAHQRTGHEIPVGADLRPLLTETTHLDTRLLDLFDLLQWARRTELLDPRQARLLLLLYATDLPIEQLAARFGRSRSTLFALRAKAQSRLRDALRPAPRARPASDERDRPAGRWRR